MCRENNSQLPVNAKHDRERQAIQHTMDEQMIPFMEKVDKTVYENLKQYTDKIKIAIKKYKNIPRIRGRRPHIQIRHRPRPHRSCIPQQACFALSQ